MLGWSNFLSSVTSCSSACYGCLGIINPYKIALALAQDALLDGLQRVLLRLVPDVHRLVHLREIPLPKEATHLVITLEVEHGRILFEGLVPTLELLFSITWDAFLASDCRNEVE